MKNIPSLLMLSISTHSVVFAFHFKQAGNFCSIPMRQGKLCALMVVAPKLRGNQAAFLKSKSFLDSKQYVIISNAANQTVVYHFFSMSSKLQVYTSTCSTGTQVAINLPSCVYSTYMKYESLNDFNHQLSHLQVQLIIWLLWYYQTCKLFGDGLHIRTQIIFCHFP